MAKINLKPNEVVLLQEEAVAHGGVMAIYTDELILTNLNIYCINKGMLGNVKNVFCYPLNQIKTYNGRPQVVRGKLSNGIETLEVYLMHKNESFNFQADNTATINKWVREVNKVFGNNEGLEDYRDPDYNPDTPVGELKEAWNGMLSELGFNTKKKKKINSVPTQEKTNIKVNKKCISCSAPLIGYKGQTVHCKYCDTDQTL